MLNLSGCSESICTEQIDVKKFLANLGGDDVIVLMSR